MQEIAQLLTEKKSAAETIRLLRENVLPEIVPEKSSAKGKGGAKKGVVGPQKMRLNMCSDERLCTVVFGLPQTYVI